MILNEISDTSFKYSSSSENLFHDKIDLSVKIHSSNAIKTLQIEFWKIEQCLANQLTGEIMQQYGFVLITLTNSYIYRAELQKSFIKHL